MKNLYNRLLEKKLNGEKSFAVLIDPDKVENNSTLLKTINMSVENKVDFFFIGGSLLTVNNSTQIINLIKENSKIPVVLFPGSNMQLDFNADAILFLSLISGRNPELLIGQHIVAAPILKKSNLEIIPTGYILVNCGNDTTVSYISNTTPIPFDKENIAVCTAMAGEMLGLKLIYLDGGSGAKNPISPKMISAVRKSVELPIIVGGGIKSAESAMKALEAGADMIVIGNGIEKNPNLLIEVSDKIIDYNKSLNIH
jgi:phosphoglycerol geranylgeranyltransferase